MRPLAGVKLDQGSASHCAVTSPERSPRENDGIGVVGVAAGAKVVAVRVLDRRGIGRLLGRHCGRRLRRGQRRQAGDVANMSLGGPVSERRSTRPSSMRRANVKFGFTLSSGNESDNALNHSPGPRERREHLYDLRVRHQRRVGVPLELRQSAGRFRGAGRQPSARRKTRVAATRRSAARPWRRRTRRASCSSATSRNGGTVVG